MLPTNPGVHMLQSKPPTVNNSVKCLNNISNYLQSQILYSEVIWAVETDTKTTEAKQSYYLSGRTGEGSASL